MPYRALVLGIVVFWCWTTARLVRTELLPTGRETTPVPITYLWKLVFLHEEPSDLVLYNQQQRLGNLHIEPHRRVVNGDPGHHADHLITAVGGFSVELPWAAKQNVVLHALLQLDEHEQMRRLEVSAVFHEPKQRNAGTTVMLDGSSGTGLWHYSIRQGDTLIKEQAGTVASLLDTPELRSLGFDPANFTRIEQEQLAKASLSAHRGILSMHGDEIDTYVVSLKDGSGLEATLHLNQLGQILAVKTPAGIELLDGALTP